MIPRENKDHISFTGGSKTFYLMVVYLPTNFPNAWSKWWSKYSIKFQDLETAVLSETHYSTVFRDSKYIYIF